METFAVFSVIALLAVITMVPAWIVRDKTDKVLYWWLATVCTGFFPGLIASLLYRYAGTAAVPAFFWGLFAFIGIVVAINFFGGGF